MGKIFLIALLCANVSFGFAQTGMSEMRDAIDQYQSDAGSLSRKYSIRESDEYYNRFNQFYADWLSKLNGFSFEKFSQAGKIDFILLRTEIEKDQHALQLHQNEFNQIKQAVPFSGKIVSIVQQRRKGTQFDGQQTAKLFSDLKKEVESAQKDLEKQPKFSERLSKKAVNAAQGLKSAVDELFSFYNDYDSQFSWWTKAPYADLDSALSRYVKFLKSWKSVDVSKDDGSGIFGNPIGRDEIIKNLEYEFISYSPEELIDVANKEFTWCEKEMLKASQEMGFGNNWKGALEKVKNDYVEPGKQPELINFLANEAIDYVEKNDLVTVPSLAKETWRMTMLSAERQRYSPFFLGGEEIQIAFPTNSMSNEDKMMSLRGNNKHFARATVFHELIPGHHLQGFMTDRYNAHRQLFYSPFWTEGWALYWEMILWEKNFQKSSENRVGMLFWRMHRCARIIFSLSYHMGKWTPQQCIDFLVDKVGHERANAAAEVRRSFTGGYGPLYQLAYMIGAKEFYAMRTELVGSGKMKEKDFHDIILQSGPMPIEILRALLTNQELQKDFKTKWRFSY
ncbi:MAG: DUF885 family protein [Cyclobacteriaceae bacterium]